jgi:PAS domain S-box-containing protein
LVELSIALKELRWERRARELLQRIALAAAESASIDLALKIALDAVCEITAWPIGHALVVSSEGALKSSGIWHLDDPDRFQSFCAVSERSTFPPNVGLPGRVLASGRPLWIMDVGVDANFPRVSEARALGVKAAFGFPVSTGRQVRAVLEFFTPEALEPDLPLLEVMSTAGTQLGRVIERTESEIALRQSEQRFRSLTETANDAIISADKHGVIIFWNRGAERAFGYRETEILGRRLAVIIPGRFRARHEAGMARVHAGGETHVIGKTVELEGLRKDGTEFPLELSLASWKIGGESYYSGIIRDITDRKTAEARLRSAAAALEASQKKAIEASAAKSIFLANMSHELRTPLNAILGFVQLMERDPGLSPSQRESLAIISESGQHLLGLVNDVLSISKIEAGQSTFSAVAFELRATLRGLWSLFQGRAQGKGLDLSFEIEDSTPEHVRGDENKLRQVLINLLGNAIKFTESGRVIVRLRWREGRASFEVEDTGPGIDPADLNRIFEPFVQSKPGTNAKEGTGLGLGIARNFVRLMGGDMHVRPASSGGACFYFEIELPRSSGDGKRAEPQRVVRLSPGQPELRILVADNDLLNRRLLARLLASVGFIVREAENGEEAVEVWRSWQPSFIWMDMRMPVMDGYDATLAIRREEKARALPRTGIVALTASAFEHDRPSILAAGCDDIVAKPFRVETLFDLLARHLGVHYERESAEESTREKADLSAERLAAISSEVRKKLAAALAEGDDLGALKIIEEIRAGDESLARALEERVRSFQIDEVLGQLEAGGVA